jgi:hypothetical protein
VSEASNFETISTNVYESVKHGHTAFSVSDANDIHMGDML